MISLVAAICFAKGIQGSVWTRVSDNVLKDLGKTHAESPDIYARGTAGISVDRTSGDVYLLANNIGICKSTNQGKTFKLVSGDAVSDPEGHWRTKWDSNSR